MKTTTHTPGPWELLPPTGQVMKYQSIRGERRPKQKRRICIVESTSPALCKANARLIAAAPELLQFCEDARALLAQLHEAMPPHACTVDCPDLGKWTRRADALIAKAGGSD